MTVRAGQKPVLLALTQHQQHPALTDWLTKAVHELYLVLGGDPARLPPFDMGGYMDSLELCDKLASVDWARIRNRRR